MFCPNCHTEYLDGNLLCADCGADLVSELPSQLKRKPGGPEPPSGLVSVYESYSLPNVAIAKSILEGAGIDYISKDEIAEAYFVVGPVIIQVDPADARRAMELLSGLDEEGLCSSDLEIGDLSGDDATEPPPGR